MIYSNGYNSQPTQAQPTGNDNKRPSPTVYSPYRFNNGESKIDPCCISTTFWNHTMKLSISPKKENTGEEVSFDFDKGISVYLNHTKARMLASEIRHFLNDPITYNSVGINSGASLVTISNGSEFGSTNPCLTIRKCDDFGNIITAFTYEFKTNYYFAVRNYVPNSTGGEFTKEYGDYNTIEIEQLCTLLEQYYKAATGAVAYTVVENSKYENFKVANKLDAIANKLGVDFGGRRAPTQSYRSNSYFNNASGSSSYDNSHGASSFSTATMDDID